MSKRNRIFIGVLLIFAAGMTFLLYRLVADLDPRYRESAEESLVETAQLMAALVEQDMRGGVIDTARLGPLFRAAKAREFEAHIFGVTKREVELRMLVTDAAGRVLFDSSGLHTGADYSQWRDVRLALRGDYGARTSTEVEGHPETATMYVGAPVRHAGRIVGAVSIGKPTRSFGQFVEAARRKTLVVGIVSAVGVVLLALLVSAWLVRPFGLTTDYLRYVRAQRRLNLPRLARQSLSVIRVAYDEMRDALAGRNYVADYVQTLTHELKSPLSAIRGATDLLQEAGMPQAERERFLSNIAREAGRIQELVDRMMELTALETQRALPHVEAVALRPLLQDVADSSRDAAALRSIRIELAPGGDAEVDGDPFLLRRGMSNLVDNAVEFSPEGSTVHLQLERTGRDAVIRVLDHGAGIPPYAQGKLFEKFYSLPRPHTGRKSTGLGLSFVHGIALLHHGRIELANAPGGGTLATLTLPANP